MFIPVLELRMYVLLHPPSLPQVASRMSAELIQFLHAHVVQYVTELMHRAIASREQERTMKGRTKVWRLDTSNVSSYPFLLLPAESDA